MRGCHHYMGISPSLLYMSPDSKFQNLPVSPPTSRRQIVCRNFSLFLLRLKVIILQYGVLHSFPKIRSALKETVQSYSEWKFSHSCTPLSLPQNSSMSHCKNPITHLGELGTWESFLDDSFPRAKYISHQMLSVLLPLGYVNFLLSLLLPLWSGRPTLLGSF